MIKKTTEIGNQNEFSNDSAQSNWTRAISGSNLRPDLKAVLTAIFVAAATQAVICGVAAAAYSETILILLTAEWFVGSILLGLNAPSARMAFYGSIALSVPSISYSMLGYGLLEMGGYFHAFAFGGMGLVIYKTIQHFKQRKNSCISAS